MATTFNGLTFADAATLAAGVDGVFLPIATLPGLTSAELADAQAGHLKYSKAISAICEALFVAITTIGFEGVFITATKPNPVGSGLNQFNQSYLISYTKVVDVAEHTVEEVPVPTTGTALGIGDIDFTDLFSNAVKISAGGDISGAGVIIATSNFAAFSSVTHGGLTINGTTDNREAIEGMIAWLGGATTLRSVSQASAVTGRTLQIPSTIAAIPAAFTTLPNPTSGILAADVTNKAILTRAVSITLNYALVPSTQLFDVNSVTA